MMISHIFKFFLFGFFLPSLLFSEPQPADTVAISLSEALTEALANNELLKKAAARTTAGKASVRQAKGEQLPNIDANFAYSYLDIVPGFKSIKLGNIQHDFFPNISISQPIYTGGKLKHVEKAAAADVRSLEQAFLSDQLDLKLAVTVGYFQLQTLISQRRVLLENRRQLETQQRYTRLLVEAGRMSQLELNRIAVAIAANDGNVLKIENDYQTVSFELSLLMGRPQPKVLLPLDSLQVIPFEQIYKELVPATMEHNPVLKQVRYELQKAEANVNMQQAANLPRVSAQAYYGYEFGPEYFSHHDNKRYFLGLNAQMPLYDGNVTDARIDKARAEREQLEWQLDYLKKNLGTQVRNSYTRLVEKEQQISIQQQAVGHAEKSYRLALIEYHAGQRSNTDLLDIQKDVLNSRLTLNQAILDYNTARAQLLAVMGIL